MDFRTSSWELFSTVNTEVHNSNELLVNKIRLTFFHPLPLLLEVLLEGTISHFFDQNVRVSSSAAELKSFACKTTENSYLLSGSLTRFKFDGNS